MSDIPHPVRVLYINHESTDNSAAQSLQLLIKNLPSGAVEAVVLSPPGPAAIGFRQMGRRVVTIPAVMNLRSIEGAPLRGVRWLTIVREMWHLRHGRRLRRVMEEVKPDLVHLNARGMHQAAWLAWRMGIPVVAHARSIADHGNPLVENLHSRLAKCVDTVISIDQPVRRSLVGYSDCEVIYNPLLIHPTAVGPDRPPGVPVSVGYIGPWLPYRGILDLLEAAKLLRWRQDIVFRIYGGNPRPEEFYDSRLGRFGSRVGLTKDFESEIRSWVASEGLEDTVHLMGNIEPTASLYRDLAILAFPGHTNALPRCVPEAGTYGIPSVVTLDDTAADIVRHDVTGLFARRSDPADLAEAIVRLVDDDKLRVRLGTTAQRMYSTQFDPRAIGRATFELYQRVLWEHTATTR